MSNVWKLQDRDEPVTDAEAIAILQRIAWGAGSADRDAIISTCYKATAALLKASLATGRKTNADRYFRQATDEEIASFLAAVNNHRQWSEQTLMQDLDADYAYYLDWLRQEVESDG